MKLNNLKSALLEYLIRNLLKSCSFTSVKPDGIYTFERSGLFFVNGRGAAHDADVLMSPPVQIPFTYPTRILFECKAYKDEADLSVVRNAFGLRNDLNEFEIVTKDSLELRKNNRRASYAVETRNRYNYQVGVACVNQFTKPAVEFAANNKIPLLSLNSFFNRQVIQAFNDLAQADLDHEDADTLDNLYNYFKNRQGNLKSQEFELARHFLRDKNKISDIVTRAQNSIKNVYVALIETGDLIFLYPKQKNTPNVLSDNMGFETIKAEIHYQGDRPNIWLLTVIDSSNNRRVEFEFFLPAQILNHWKQFNLDKAAAIDIKEEFFSRIFIFGKNHNREYPFLTVKIDQEWLNRARNEMVQSTTN